MHSQIVCRGCKILLLYPARAANVQCVACSTVTPVYPQGAGMDRIVCGRCRTPLMYDRGATSVRCACCHAITPVTRENSTSLVNCGHCRITLMFPRDAHSVRCSRCDFVTNITSGAGSVPIAGPRSAENALASTQANSMTVVVENPMTLNEKGKLVSNVAVGIASSKK